MAAHQMPVWLSKIQQELAPTHGRYEGALRTAFAATLATYVLLVLQTPLIAPGVYLIYLVSYDVPYLTFKTSVLELFYQCVGVTLSLMLIAVTGNDPVARVLGVAAFTFLSAFLLRACTVRVAAMNLGIFPILTLSLWELHLPPEQLVHLSMWPVATGAVAVAIKVAIEYTFARRDPNHALQAEMKARLEALQQLFLALAAGEPAQEMKRKVAMVSRYAFAGQGKMLSLLEEVRRHSIPEDSPQPIPPALISYIARLLDVSASFTGSDSSVSDELREPGHFCARGCGRNWHHSSLAWHACNGIRRLLITCGSVVLWRRLACHGSAACRAPQFVMRSVKGGSEPVEQGGRGWLGGAGDKVDGVVHAARANILRREGIRIHRPGAIGFGRARVGHLRRRACGHAGRRTACSKGRHTR